MTKTTAPTTTASPGRARQLIIGVDIIDPRKYETNSPEISFGSDTKSERRNTRENDPKRTQNDAKTQPSAPSSRLNILRGSDRRLARQGGRLGP